jgi:hypothetical protein
MSEKISQIFKKLEVPEPSPGLLGAVLQRIELEKTKKTRTKRMISELGFVFSALAAVWVGATFGSEILQSEFWKLISLAFSDLETVAGDWKDYLYSLLETFPAIYAAAIAAPIFTLLLSINGYLNNHNHNRRYGAHMAV